jgi:hypothetical protein
MLVMSLDGENGDRCHRDPKNNTGDESRSEEVGNDGANCFGVDGHDRHTGASSLRVSMPSKFIFGCFLFFMDNS